MITGYIPQLYYLYNSYNTTYHPYIAPIYRFLLLTQSYFYRYLFPTLYPLYTLTNAALRSLSSDSPDVLTIIGLAVVLFLSMKALDYMRRSIIYWISLAIRLGMYATILGVGVYVWNRGLEQSIEDFGWVYGLLEGLGDEGQKVGNKRARGSRYEADRIRQAKAGRRGRTRGAGW